MTCYITYYIEKIYMLGHLGSLHIVYYIACYKHRYIHTIPYTIPYNMVLSDLETDVPLTVPRLLCYCIAMLRLGAKQAPLQPLHQLHSALSLDDVDSSLGLGGLWTKYFMVMKWILCWQHCSSAARASVLRLRTSARDNMLKELPVPASEGGACGGIPVQ